MEIQNMSVISLEYPNQAFKVKTKAVEPIMVSKEDPGEDQVDGRLKANSNPIEDTGKYTNLKTYDINPNNVNNVQV